MIFENAYGEWIKNQLNENIRKINPDVVVKLYDEVVYKPLYSNPNTVALVINGGNASRSAVSGLDQNIMPLSIMLLCRDCNKLAVRNAMDYLQENYNAVTMELAYLDNVTGDTYLEKVKSIFNTPMVLDERDHPTRTETIKITVMQMTASVIYGKNAYINPIDFKISIGGTTYPIEHIASYNMASTPSYDEYQAQGDTYLDRNDLAQCAAFSFTLYRVNETGFQEILDNELLCKADGLRGKSIKLLAYTNPNDSAYYTEIPITKYSLAESYVNNASAYQLTLGR